MAVRSQSVTGSHAREFDAGRYVFHNFTVAEVVAGMAEFLADVRRADRRSVSREAVDTVMAALLAHCETGAAPAAAVPQPATTPAGSASADVRARSLSKMISEAECEEAMSDR